MELENSSTLASRPVKEIYAVSRLVRESKQVLEGSFPLLWVEGEISNLAMPASGHIYFTLKDEVAQVRCAMFKMRNRHIRFTPKNGMQVLLRVRVTLYEGRGEFQIIAEHMEEAGSGALQRAYEALRHRLGDEGLFDTEYKKALPQFPNTIGIISSPDGAAVHDILSVLKRRYSAANVILYPVAVQGAESAKRLKQSLELAESRSECDVLIMSRGGGSLEDLWSFNDEALARAIFKCTIPIVSAVGHEVDFTIADFVADVRAPTPSVAAELVVPDASDWRVKLQQYQRRLNGLITQIIRNKQQHVDYLHQLLPEPRAKIQQQRSELMRLDQQLQRNIEHIIHNKRQNLAYWAVRLTHPQANIDVKKQRVSELSLRLDRSVKHLLQSQRTHFTEIVRVLSVVSPLNTLDRGYSITTEVNTHNVVSNVDELEKGQQLKVKLQHGHFLCDVNEIVSE